MSTSGNMVRRSRSPLPLRTTISRRAKSRSLTRSCNASSSRSPDPYSSPATSAGVPRISRSTAHTSSRVNTTGRRSDRFARTRPAHRPSGRPNTAWLQEHERRQGLGLRGRAHPAVDRETGQKALDVPLPHLEWMPHLTKPHEPPRPPDISLLGPTAVNGAPASPPAAASTAADHQAPPRHTHPPSPTLACHPAALPSNPRNAHHFVPNGRTPPTRCTRLRRGSTGH